MKLEGIHRKLVDYIFWIAFILFTNPGGILEALGEDSGDGGINAKDFIFVILLLALMRGIQQSWILMGQSVILAAFMLIKEMFLQ